MKQRLGKMVSALLVATMCLSVIAIGVYSPYAAEVDNESVSASAIKSRDEAVAWLRAQEGARYDIDGAYGSQCSDFTSAYVNYVLTGNPYGGRIGVYNANQYSNANLYPSDWQVFANTPSFLPEPGDIFVVNGADARYGHTGVVISSDIYAATIADQNGMSDWSLDYGSPAHIHNITWTSSGTWAAQYYIRPNFASRDNSGPSISNARAENVTGGSFDIKCDLSDNVGVTRVWLVVYSPSGEKQFGVAASNGAFSYRINTADYGGEGDYAVHIYAFDGADNGSPGVAINNIIARNSFTSTDAINLGNDFVAKITHVNSGKRISAYSDNKVILQSKDNSDNQNWHFTRNADGSYRVTNVKLNQCMDVQDSKTANGTKICYWTPTNNNNQKWYIVRNKYGYGLVPLSCPWAALDVPGNETKDGTAIEQYQWNESNAQNFTIDYVSLTPTKTIEVNGHKYEFYNNNCTWWQAYRTCEKMGGHLVSVTSKSENDKMLELTNGYSGSVWIGATRFGTTSWYWVNSEPYIENNLWADGEPNNTGGKEESAHLYISGANRGKWNDVTGYNSGVEGFICEYDDIVNAENYKPSQSADINGYTYELYDYGVDWQTAKKICEKKVVFSQVLQARVNMMKHGS